ncbi:MAG: hypothetical protein JWM78_1722 [Verrucomicrobiaceae bacterium]|nr:hypothetical protein [Verrucomicrobiaceae bacterium]
MYPKALAKKSLAVPLLKNNGIQKTQLIKASPHAIA